MRLFDSIKNSLEKMLSQYDDEFDKIISDSFLEYGGVNRFYYSTAVSHLKNYTDIVAVFPDKRKLNFVVYCIRRISDYEAGQSEHRFDDPQFACNCLRKGYIEQIFKSHLESEDVDVQNVATTILTNQTNTRLSFKDWHLNAFVTQIQRQYKGKVLSPVMVEALGLIRKCVESSKNQYLQKEKAKLLDKIDTLLFEASGNQIRPVLFQGEDDFVPFANTLVTAKPEEEHRIWYNLIEAAHKATGAKPSKKFLDETKTLINELGSDKFKKMIYEWFDFLVQLKERTIEETHTYAGRDYRVRKIEFLSAVSMDAIKGFVWMSAHFHDGQTIQSVAKLAERCFKKIPQKGPAAVSIGNACLFALFHSKGLDGIGQLSRLRLKIKQTNTLTLIEKYLGEAAQKLGISTDEIEDLAVDDFRLKEGRRDFEFENYKCVLELTGIGKSCLRWFKADGQEQKSVPAFVKEKHATRLKKVKDIQKQVDRTTTAQRDRLDRILRAKRSISLDYFKEKYLQHGLLSFIARKIIFTFSIGESEAQAIYHGGNWKSSDLSIIRIDEYEHVALWHPVTSSTTEVKKWRDFLLEYEIQQPFKQAFREIYLLTEAEIQTSTYSNRMASHILKQHQYVTLAKGRNWSAKLIGSWDGGDRDTAKLNLPAYHLRAEYWVNALAADNAWNETGIWNYVTTDQIRFVDTRTQELVELINVPPIAFSEVLRDVDLFVGVASVGNDPTWQDSGGLPVYRDYWQAYSFGDLSEIAKNRKETLIRLIPRLKIAKVTTIEDKFIVVRGKLRTYKIHIGSTNILMEPNDQYLCIVPDQSKKVISDKIFLPFEGDNGLSIILSKALLLAEDDKITETAITSQIHRR